MPPEPGSFIGPYEVLAVLGAGGMGEVYRAHDTKLGRDIALKLLPEAFASDPDRLMRFAREARTLASLNHPHIANIDGIEDSGSTRALVMELVEGEGPDEKIASRGLPLDEALPIARQICEALEAAHEAGIIHRDLKPANIRVRPDGTVKVLDFGLAKRSGIGDQGSGASADSRAANSPTITSPALTMQGVIIGTAAYMAPEQAKGKPLDKRADIWAFGCVLYEMLTATRAFPGEDITDTIAAVVSKEPDWTRLPAATPAAVTRLLRRALVKDRRNRLADLGSARLEIDEAQAAPVDVRPATVIAAPRRVGSTWVWGLGSMVFALLAAAGAYLATRSPERVAGPLYRSTLLIPQNLNPRAPSARIALSPDGTRLAYVATDNADARLRLWVRALDGTTGQSLAGTEGAISPFWSPDSRSIAFFADNQLKKIDVSGSPPLTICTLPAAPPQVLPGTWSPQGVIVFSDGPLARVSAAGGVAEAIGTADAAAGETLLAYPHFLPDGRRFVFTSFKGLDPIATYIAAIDDPAPENYGWRQQRAIRERHAAVSPRYRAGSTTV